MHFLAKYARTCAVKVLVCMLAACAGTFDAHAQWDKDVFSWRGRRALSEGKYSLAIENFNVLASLDTTDYWTFFFRGIAKYNLGDLRGAQADFNTSVRLNPVFTNGYHYRAITESRVGRFDEAFADYEKAISLRPGTEGLYYSRGVAYFLNQQFSKAVQDFNRYIRKQPKDPSAYLNRGASYLYLKDTTAALNDYNKAIQLDRFEAEAYVRRGRLLASQGKLDEAVTDMNKALDLDPDNTFALFNRALMLFDRNDYIPAMADFNKILELEPGNALTLYNRGLVRAQVGDYNGALDDLDRVVNINPENVLVYFNRASVFIRMERYRDALKDYDKAIELYPDFAKAYMNRSYVKRELGMLASSKEDYEAAGRKVAEYRAKNLQEGISLSDTTGKFSGLLALDAEFAGKNFNDELLQHRDVDVKLRPMYRFTSSSGRAKEFAALRHRYENARVDRFVATAPKDMEVVGGSVSECKWQASELPSVDGARAAFVRALYDCENKQFNSALANYDVAVNMASDNVAESMNLPFYLMNRAVLRSEMIDFLNSMQNNVQVLTMDENGSTRARIKDQVVSTYDFSQAIDDLRRAEALAPGVAYISYDLANLYCLAGEHIAAIAAYTRAIEAYPYMGDAYFNRAIVQIYLRDKEKGCNDLSVAGELGVKQAYSVIKKYCDKNEVH